MDGSFKDEPPKDKPVNIRSPKKRFLAEFLKSSNSSEKTSGFQVSSEAPRSQICSVGASQSQISEETPRINFSRIDLTEMFPKYNKDAPSQDKPPQYEPLYNEPIDLKSPKKTFPRDLYNESFDLRSPKKKFHRDLRSSNSSEGTFDFQISSERTSRSQISLEEIPRPNLLEIDLPQRVDPSNWNFSVSEHLRRDSLRTNLSVADVIKSGDRNPESNPHTENKRNQTEMYKCPICGIQLCLDAFVIHKLLLGH